MLNNRQRRLQLEKLADIGRWNAVHAAALLNWLVVWLDSVLA